ncbi:hypothetical protein ACYJ1Y_10865 [Natrialbaceae archaeon A-gly3]
MITHANRNPPPTATIESDPDWRSEDPTTVAPASTAMTMAIVDESGSGEDGVIEDMRRQW